MTEKTIHMRNRVPETIVEALRIQADENMRSVTAELVHILRKHLGMPAPKRTARKTK
jgi:plasmid stability protein